MAGQLEQWVGAKRECVCSSKKYDFWETVFVEVVFVVVEKRKSSREEEEEKKRRPFIAVKQQIVGTKSAIN